jgi:hypothetical protein
VSDRRAAATYPMKHRHRDDAGPKDRRSRHAERRHPRTLTQEGRTVVRQPVARHRRLWWPGSVRDRIRWNELTAWRRGVNCCNLSGRSGFLSRGGRYPWWQRATVCAATGIGPLQLGRCRGCLALPGWALAVLGLGGTLTSDRPGSTGAGGTGDRLAPSFHRRRFVRGRARAAGPTGDPLDRSRPADRRARLTPLVRHEYPRGGVRAADAAGAGAQSTASNVFGDIGRLRPRACR